MTEPEPAAATIGYRWASRWNERDLDGLASLYSPECRSSDMADGSGFDGTQGIRRVYKSTLEHLPDFRLRCESSFGAHGLRHGLDDVGHG